ncbi:hypothetical protein [Streptomyces sp. NPDC059909]|uniref:hypothetical protein n=1 Tax=Streptomyces sp. NPDC059909 TaxID=3346998 RepID=UPI00365B3486
MVTAGAVVVAVPVRLRTSEVAAAMRAMAMARVKTTIRPSWKGPGDQVREEVPPGQDGGVGRRQVAEHGRAEELLDGIVAEEGGEQDLDRRQRCDGVCGWGGYVLGGEAGAEGVRQRAGESGHHLTVKMRNPAL